MMLSNHSYNSSTNNDIDADSDLSLDPSTKLDRSSKRRCSCDRLRSEWNLSLFSLTDTTLQTIDLKETFAPSDNHRDHHPHHRRLYYGTFKAIIFVWTLSVLIMDISYFGADKEFWLAYLTHWGVIMCFATNLCSLLTCLYFSPHSINTFGRLDVNMEAKIIRIIWALSVVTINVALLIVLLYWTLDYKGQSVTYLNCMKHGIIALYTTIDVLMINRIPMRFKQVFFVTLFELIYFLWLMIHAVANIGTPWSDGDPTTDDDAMYSSVNWKKRPGSAVVVVIGATFLLTPVLYLFLWFLSSLLQPRYRDGSYVDVDDDNIGIGIIEEGQESKQRSNSIDRSDTIDFSKTCLDGSFEDTTVTF